jgi:parvulin-like peptidyl-prolyl isomerase
MSEAVKKNMGTIITAVVTAVVVYLIAGGSKAPSVERTYSGDVVAKVNGQDVKEEEIRERLDFITNGKAGSVDLANIDETGMKALAKEVYVQKLVLDEAVKSEVKSDKAFQNALATLIGTAYKQKYLEVIAKKDITDAKVKKTYDELIAKAKNAKQYKVKHALFKTESEATSAKTKITEGASLEDIAKADSLDKLSASKGGDLGYIFADEFVKEFAEAVKSAKQGEITGPVKTEFGFHILKVEDSKPAEIVTFDQAKPRIEKQLGSDAIKAHVEAISKDLDIKLLKKFEPAKDAKPAAGKEAPAKAEESK